MRTRHDLCGEFISSYGHTLLNYFNQEETINTIQSGLESCAVAEGLWQIIKLNKPDLLTLILAEHLSGHFSGKNRNGSVEIIENKEKYQLILNPCGTWGAIRTRNLKGTTTLQQPNNNNWQTPNKVCTYCAHCSKNEQTSLKRFGFIAFITDFQENPNHCSWIIYKDPKKLPKKYLTRLK